MPPYFSKPPPISRPPILFIYSQFTLQKSLKNYPKHFKTLKLEAQSPQFLSKAHLKSLHRRTKSLTTLNLERYEPLFDLTDHKVLVLVKSFPHIKSLTLRGDTYRYYFTKSLIKWLSQSKYLIHLTYGDITRSDQMHRRESQSKKSPLPKSRKLKYEKALKRTRLLSLNLQSHEALSSQTEKSYPPSLKTISMISFGSIYGIFSGFHLDLSRLRNLSTLHLVLQTFFGYILEILDSLPNPEKLTCLSICACNAFEQDTKSNLSLPETLHHFRPLNSLHLSIFSFLFVSTLLESLTNPSKLCQLVIHTTIKKPKQLQKLGYLISNLQNLSSLAITNQDSIERNAKKAHWKFFSRISKLKQLKSLQISLCREDTVWGCTPIKNSNECLKQFANCLRDMQELQEIDFRQSEICPEEELQDLAEALKNRGSKLKTLKIKFANRQQRDHLAVFNKALETMGNLEKLKLEKLFIKKASVGEFCKAISCLKWLRFLKLEVMSTDLDQATLTGVVKNILIKPGLRKLKWFEKKIVGEPKDLGEGNSIDIKEVIMRNPQLYKINWGYSYEKKQIIVFKNMTDFIHEVHY